MTTTQEALKNEHSKYQLFIGGKWVDAESGKTFESINPATGETHAIVAEAGTADVDKAVAAARKAFESGPWPKMSAHKRGKLLQKVADLIAAKAAELARIETTDNGKPIRESTYIDVPGAVEHWEYFAGMATKIQGSTIPTSNNFLTYTLREPVGVCAGIIPWNFPLLMASWKLAPALAAGNTCVLKPAEITSCSALELGKIVQEAGIPDGVVNIVSGKGSVAGAALSAHMGVDKVAFTGSTEVGKQIAESAARSNLKKVSLELGGKAPNVVFADADIDQAVAGSLFAIYFNQGQVCTAGSRLLVHEAIHDSFMEKFVSRAKALRIGDPMDKTTHVGPQVSAAQLKTIRSYVEIGSAEGAVLASGGKQPEGVNQNGYYIEPTVFDRVGNGMRIAQEEIFGPVVSVIAFQDEDDLIAKANQTIYGLSAGIWTRDVRRAHRFAKAVKAGVVWVNTFNVFSSAAPFGGVKQSGYGREMGYDAIDLYTQTKTVWVDLSGEPNGWFSK